MRAFCRALGRQGAKLARIEFVGDLEEFSKPLLSHSRLSKEDRRLDAEKASRQLSDESTCHARVSKSWVRLAGNR